MTLNKLSNRISRKRDNWICVNTNHIEILQLTKLTKLRKVIFLIPVPPDGGGGNIEHYYHFIFDLVLPLFCLSNKTFPNTMFLIEDFGIFTDRLLQIFPESVEIANGVNKQKNIHETKLIGMNPKYVFLKKEILEDLKQSICSRLKINIREQPRNILLIERMPPDEYFLSKAQVKGGGASRRSIINHAELLSTLASMIKSPFKFHNLQLEKMSFEDQISYFDRALVVIAQHGAGLANCIWMRSEAVVIEFSHDKNLDHFRLISKLRQLHYFFYKINSRHATIDIEDFTSWLLKQSILKQYFGVAE